MVMQGFHHDFKEPSKYLKYSRQGIKLLGISFLFSFYYPMKIAEGNPLLPALNDSSGNV